MPKVYVLLAFTLAVIASSAALSAPPPAMSTEVTTSGLGSTTPSKPGNKHVDLVHAIHEDAGDEERGIFNMPSSFQRVEDIIKPRHQSDLVEPLPRSESFNGIEEEIQRWTLTDDKRLQPPIRSDSVDGLKKEKLHLALLKLKPHYDAEAARIQKLLSYGSATTPEQKSKLQLILSELERWYDLEAAKIEDQLQSKPIDGQKKKVVQSAVSVLKRYAVLEKIRFDKRMNMRKVKSIEVAVREALAKAKREAMFKWMFDRNVHPKEYFHQLVLIGAGVKFAFFKRLQYMSWCIEETERIEAAKHA